MKQKRRSKSPGKGCGEHPPPKQQKNETTCNGYGTDTSQHSAEESPGNNVYVSDPISMGMHIKPYSHGGMIGHRILMVDEGSLASRAKLQVDDILISINDICIKEHTQKDVLQLFSTMSKTFCLSVLRQDIHAIGDNPEYVRIPITVGVYVTGDEIDGTTPYKFTSSVSISISQKTAALNRHLKVTDDRTVIMTSYFEDDQCQITMNLYNSRRDSPAQVITLCNASNSSALETGNQEKIVLTNANNLTSGNICLDNRFFYHHTTRSREHVFEQVEKRGHYLTFDSSSNGLKLTSHNSTSVNTLPAICRFSIYGWDSIQQTTNN